MRETLAVALLDFRRLGSILVSLGLMAGLGPALITGLGGSIPVGSQLAVVFLMVGVAAGGTFGSDFAEGRGSFFFARPLTSVSLIAGRLAGLGALAAITFAAYMASFWLSSSEAARFEPTVLHLGHARFLCVGWVLSLFGSLAVAVHARGQGPARRLRDIFGSGLRMLAILAAFLVTFGLFTDLIVRAYFGSTAPVRAFLWSWVAVCLGASCAAIIAGRSERLRIARFLGGVMGAYLALASTVVLAAWTYILHPGPGAIRAVAPGIVVSPDGLHAFVAATVDRGDPTTFRPVFHVDLTSNQIARFNADPNQGPWFSAEGRVTAWSEATPFFFRPFLRFATGATSYRMRMGGGVEPMPMPRDLAQSASSSDLVFRGFASHVLPSFTGDVFAIEWKGHLTFTSRTGAELSDLDLGAEQSHLAASAFLPSGELRAAIVRRGASIDQLDLVDIQPESGATKLVGSVKVSRSVDVRFDATATHALLQARTLPRRMTVTLLSFGARPEALSSVVLIADAFNPTPVFLSGGRIGLLAGGGRSLRILGMTGELLHETPIEQRTEAQLAGEMFPGIVAIMAPPSRELRLSDTADGGVAVPGWDLLLFDTAGGGLVRHLHGTRSVLNASDATPPPAGSPGARLMWREQQLYSLAAPGAEPRQILPAAQP